jgi:hypothetical protein
MPVASKQRLRLATPFGLMDSRLYRVLVAFPLRLTPIGSRRTATG